MTGTVKYTEEVVDPITGIHRWIGIELQYDMNLRSAFDVFTDAEKEVAAFAKHKKEPTVFSTEKVDKEIKVGDLYSLIESCNDLVSIDSFRLIVQSKKDDNLMEVWNLRRQQILKKETDGFYKK